MKKNLLSVAVVAGLSLGVSSQASASVYASSRVLIENFGITINGGVLGGGAIVPGDVKFNTNASAQLNGTNVSDPSECGTQLGLTACPVNASPVLTSLANAPGSTASRAAGDFNYMGPDTPVDTNSYANSQATIVTSEIFNPGQSTVISQISEVELQGNGSGSADSLVSSTTQFAFTVPGGATTVDVDFTANVDRYVSVNTAGLIGNAIAEANTEFTFSLIGTNGVNVQWTPDGQSGGFACGPSFLPFQLTACVENADSEQLSGNTSLPPFVNPFAVRYSDDRPAPFFGPDAGQQAYGFSISNLAAGAYTLALTVNTSVNASQTVPEPSNLALLGLGLFGMGFVQRRKAAKKA